MEDILTNEERFIYSLRSIYHSCGYRHYKMSRFEEYDLYAANKSFLGSTSLITFTDVNGRLMALKPDVTLSAANNFKPEEGKRKLYYNESVFRVPEGSRSYREITQTGIECMGDIGASDEGEVIMMAVRSLEAISPSCCLDISHMGIISGMLSEPELGSKAERDVMRLLRHKDGDAMKALCLSRGMSEDKAAAFGKLALIYGSMVDKLPELRGLCVNAEMKQAFSELEELCGILSALGVAGRVNIDFSITGEMEYYSSVLMSGFVEGIPNAVLKGGRYDNLMKRLGKSAGAIGFAVYTDNLGRIGEVQ